MFVSSSMWKNSVNVAIGDIRMLIDPWVLKSLNNIMRIQSRIVSATFNAKPFTTSVFCYNPTNVSDESDGTTFYDELTSLAGHIPKHNILINGGEMNA